MRRTPDLPADYVLAARSAGAAEELCPYSCARPGVEPRAGDPDGATRALSRCDRAAYPTPPTPCAWSVIACST